MTKLNFEKLKKSNTGPSYPNSGSSIAVSPYQDNKEEFICSIPEGEINDPEFRNYLNKLIGLLKHMGTEIYLQKTSKDQKMLFYQMRNLHEALINNAVQNYYGSVHYRKIIKLIEINGLWDADWLRTEKKLSDGRIKAMSNLLKHMSSDNYLNKSAEDRKMLFYQMCDLHEILSIRC